MTTRTVTVGVLLLLAGCTTPTFYRNSLHPQYGQTEFDRDWYECRRENTQVTASGYSIGTRFGTTSGYDAGPSVNEDMARRCLAARGWRPAPRSSLESQAIPATGTSTAGTTGIKEWACPSGEYWSFVDRRCLKVTRASKTSESSLNSSEERSRTERLRQWGREALARPYNQAHATMEAGFPRRTTL
jgi:hypothetical protein